MDKVIKKYKNTYPDSKYYQYLEEMNIPKINGDINQEYKLLQYLLTLKRKYMYIFLNEDPKLKEYEYKKKIIFSKLGFANFIFFVLNKKPFYKKVVLYVYIYKKKQKVDPYFETSENNIFKTILSETTIEWLNQSLYLKRRKKLNLQKSLKELNIFCNYLTSTYNNFELDSIVLKTGTIYLLNGLRCNSDLDMFIYNYQKININDFPKLSKKYDIIKLNKTTESYSNYLNLLIEPHNFFYYKGIKILTLKSDLLYIRILREAHPRAIADYIMVDYLLGQKYKKPNYSKSKRFKKNVLYFIKKRYKVYDFNPFSNIKS